MMHEEFTELAGVQVSAEEYAAIEMVYMNSDLDKHEFCKMWRKMNASRVKAAKERAIESEKDNAAMDAVYNIYSRIRMAGAAIRPELAGDFLTEKERKALMRFGIGVWDYGWDREKDTTDIYHEITQLIEQRAA